MGPESSNAEGHMLNPITFLKKPEYFFHPSQALRRFCRIWRPPQAVETVPLPWGLPVRVRTAEGIESDVFYYGIFDRIVPEAIWRLLDEGETAVDIGANFGQNSSAMAFRSGPSGRVIAFEPHPEIFKELMVSASLWPAPLTKCIQFENVALGADNGEAWLAEGPEFQHNRGLAKICEPATTAGQTFKVRLCKLDDYIAESTSVGVCKIDVEGYELSVLQGATRALTRRAIRDIIFEDFNPMPSPVVKLLENHGFTVFQLTAGWLKPSLTPAREGIKLHKGFSHNYLATLDLQRTVKRFRAPCWRCLAGF